MASVNIDYNCGCNFTTRDLEAACKHADSNGHALTVVGSVRGAKIIKAPKTISKTASKATIRSTSEPKPEPVLPAFETELFSGLRSKLSQSKKD